MAYRRQRGRYRFKITDPTGERREFTTGSGSKAAAEEIERRLREASARHRAGKQLHYKTARWLLEDRQRLSAVEGMAECGLLPAVAQIRWMAEGAEPEPVLDGGLLRLTTPLGEHVWVNPPHVAQVAANSAGGCTVHIVGVPRPVHAIEAAEVVAEVIAAAASTGGE